MSTPRDSNPLERIQDFLAASPSEAHRYFHALVALGRPLLLRTEIMATLRQMLEQDDQDDSSPCGAILAWCQEAVVMPPCITFALRKRVARWLYLRINLDSMSADFINATDFLRCKEQLVDQQGADPWELEIDFAPFSREFFKLQEAGSIGRGAEYLNRRLASGLFEELGEEHNRLLRFLHLHRHRDQQLLLLRRLDTTRELRRLLRQALMYLEGLAETQPWHEIAERMQGLGLAPGWGCDVATVRETMTMLLDLLEAPAPDALERFLARIPMVFSIVIVSPHGYFAQGQVLGRPDTGGQVVYILDQVRALEQEMRASLARQGLEIEPAIVVLTRLLPEADGTTCDQRLEAVSGTSGCRILRVPFRTQRGELVPQWISRFEVWPYLESFALEAEQEVLALLGGRPDLIVGNYSDGNLVATLMGQRLGITRCNIAHALEKTKYLYSNLYWRDNESRYHFSCQFTADLLAMNAADFIIASTYQEIAGSADAPGHTARGRLTDPDKPLIMTMARMDRIKNLTGMVHNFGAHEGLRRQANLLVIGGHIDPAASGDAEEVEQIRHMHHLLQEYGLAGQVRWLGLHLDKQLAGELYRRVADFRGVFVQPALFEAFGLTVIEAMASGLPTFATRFGGPREIIVDGVSGFHINPTRGDKTAEIISTFFDRCADDPAHWDRVAAAGIQRVQSRYTWRLYAQRMMTYARIYGFWRYLSDLERMETRRYLETLYALLLRPRAAGMLTAP